MNPTGYAEMQPGVHDMDMRVRDLDADGILGAGFSTGTHSRTAHVGKGPPHARHHRSPPSATGRCILLHRNSILIVPAELSVCAS